MEYWEQEEAAEEGIKKSRGKILLAAGIVLILIAAGTSVVLLRLGIRQENYNSAIQMANRYFTAGDYQSAVYEYQKAIKIDNKKEEAYRMLSSVYESAGDYTSALAVIEQGLGLLDSDYLEERRITLQSLIDKGTITEGAKILSADEIEKISKDVVIENTTFDLISAYTYTEYFRDFGQPSDQQREQDEVTLFYGDLELYATYCDLPDEKVLDSNFMPVATAKPVKVRLKNIRRLFSASEDQFAVSAEKITALFGDTVVFSEEKASGMHYVSAEYKGCSVRVETDENGNIISEEAWNELRPLNRLRFEEEEEADGKVGGYVQDAMTGRGMKASLKIRQRGRKSGDVIEELTSGTDGSYTYAGAHGSYTAEVSAQGYVTEYLDLEITKGQTRMGKNIVLSPEVMEGEIRIVLTWGSSPLDLDAYAIGTSSAGGNFNIHFSRKNEADVGSLDVDKRSGYGPETITITDVGAEFTYSVMDYLLEGTMPSSQAVVKVYLPGASVQEYHVPSGEGVLWEVFRYKDGALSPINRIYKRDEISANSSYKTGE